MLNISVLDTEEFLAWVGQKSPLTPSNLGLTAIRKQLSSKFCAVALSDHQQRYDPERRPIVVVDERKVRDFFAFVSTYVTDYTPFSAFFRVVTTGQLDLLADDLGLTTRNTKPVVQKLVGTAIVEVALYLRSPNPHESGRPITLAATGATYSAAAIQGLALSPNADVFAIGRGWQALRSELGGEQLPLDIEALGSFWQVVQLAVHGGGSSDRPAGESVMIRSMRQVIESGRIEDSVLEDLLSSLPELRGDLSRFRGTREGRARAIQEAISLLNNSTGNAGQLRDCVAGCLLSLLGGGSFRFIPAALSAGPGLPMAPLWFAAWSGLQASSDIMTEFNCMGRRMARDWCAERVLYSFPTDDISVLELAGIGPDIEQLPRGQAGSVSVEIYPGVSSRQSISRVGAVSMNSRAEQQRDIKELRALMAHSSAILSRMDSSSASESIPKSDRPPGRNTNARRKY
ncbi:hypothetical protein ACFSQT_11545 [Mesorhizobium calcicola]|uniref:Uncharacterized protein n=1 Tax=Mesorhizobium calcicola TaxID=1300310 RepID=A0ABW4WEA0_9HYPH